MSPHRYPSPYLRPLLATIAEQPGLSAARLAEIVYGSDRAEESVYTIVAYVRKHSVLPDHLTLVGKPKGFRIVGGPYDEAELRIVDGVRPAGEPKRPRPPAPVCPYCGYAIVSDVCRCSAPHNRKHGTRPREGWSEAAARARFARPSFFDEPDPLILASARPGIAAGGRLNGVARRIRQGVMT